jgi:hypothetical protein
MDLQSIPKLFAGSPFRRIVWFAPAAYAVHILEELPRFPLWVNTYFAPGFTTLGFVIANTAIMAVLLGFTTLVSSLRSRLGDFLYFCWLFGQLFHNALFHLGATAYFGAYSPGVVSGVLLYLPVSYCIARAARREARLGPASGIAALVIGAAGLFLLVYFNLLHRTIQI